jgi:hypothetical protein
MKPFQFLTLRYLHDAITGEFANLGVVVYIPGEFLGARFNSRTRRLRAIFGQVEKSHLKSLIGYIDRRIHALSAEMPGALIERHPKLQELANSILPPDDSAVQWSTVQSGLTRDPAEELERLFSRLVTRYEESGKTRHRTDQDVWRAFSAPLKEKQVLDRLTEKKLVAPDFEHTFEHAWKNGVWNLYEPLAFDYEDPAGIQEKAGRWLGRGVALNDAKETHKFWFLVGEPETDKLKRATEKALNLLHKIGPGKVAIVREQEREAFSEQLAEQLRAHDAEVQRSS